jgi:hypothetical protein
MVEKANVVLFFCLANRSDAQSIQNIGFTKHQNSGGKSRTVNDGAITRAHQVEITA